MSLTPAAAPRSDDPARLSPFLRRFLVGLCACFALYGGVYIWKTSFVIDGERYFCLFDDAMISMQYARNLASGVGLRWFAGDPPVEGFTNPLWVVFMAVLHWLPVPMSKISLLVQATGLLLLTANIVAVARLSNLISRGSALAVIAASLGTAFYLPLNTWALQGMEVGALVLIVTVATTMTARRTGQSDPSVPWRLYALLGLATYVRVDAAIFSFVLLGWLTVQESRLRRAHLGWGFGILIGCLAVQTALRYWYFGALFPNTYYLKMSGYPTFPRILHGMAVFGDFVWKTSPFFLAAGLFSLWGLRRNWNLGLIALVFFGQCAYSTYVGGDAWEWWGGANRYICIAMPMMFILASETLAGLRRRMNRTSFLTRVAVAGFLAGVVLLPNLARGPEAVRELVFIDQPLHWAGNEVMVRTSNRVKRITTADAKVAVIWAGSLPYFSQRHPIDLLGKCDARIAHLPMRRTWSGPGFDWGTDFYPGHLKYDFGYSVGTLAPDVLVVSEILPVEIFPEYQPVLQLYPKGPGVTGTIVYVRTGSPRLVHP